MSEVVIAFVTETARILYEGSLYILLGFLIAGLLQEFLPGATIARHLGRASLGSVARVGSRWRAARSAGARSRSARAASRPGGRRGGAGAGAARRSPRS